MRKYDPKINNEDVLIWSELQVSACACLCACVPIKFFPFLPFLHLISQLNFLPDVSGCTSLPCLVCNPVSIHPVFLIVTVQKPSKGIVHPKPICLPFLLLFLFFSPHHLKAGVGSHVLFFFNKLERKDHNISSIPSISSWMRFFACMQELTRNRHGDF